MSRDLTFFTADTHFGHKAMLTYCNRPYSNVDDMDEDMIRIWNETVPENGLVYHLGDFSFRPKQRTVEILKLLNGKKYLIEGNHDRGLSAEARECFEWVRPYHELSHVWRFVEGKQKMVLCHYAMRVWNQSHYGAWMLHGHSHGSLPPIGRQMDVGADTNNLKPYSFFEIANELEKRPMHTVDHHKDRER